MISPPLMRHRLRLRTMQLSLSLLLAVVAPGVAAHAIVIHSVPMANATLSTATLEVALQFNSRIDRQRSRFRIIGTGDFALPLTLNDSGDSDRISAPPVPLAPGDYSLEWQVLGADGHITRGFIPFHIKTP